MQERRMSSRRTSTTSAAVPAAGTEGPAAEEPEEPEEPAETMQIMAARTPHGPVPGTVRLHALLHHLSVTPALRPAVRCRARGGN